MAASQALFAKGTLLRIGDGGQPTESFSTITEVFGLAGPNLVQDVIEVTNHDSPQGFKEWIGGLLEAGEVSGQINYQPTNATHAGMRSDLLAHTKRNFNIVWPPAGPTWAFSALITKFDIKASEKSQLIADFSLKITGPVS